MKTPDAPEFPEDWNFDSPPPPQLSPEEIILWLDGYRQMMWEVWRKNPELRKQWERLNQ